MARGRKQLGIRESARKSERRNRLVWAALLFAAFFAAVVALDAYRCVHEFITTEYEIASPKIKSPVTIAMLSDLHESEFGKNNEKLIAAVKGLSPDLILCVGDMFTRGVSDEKLNIALDLMRALTETAPVYYSLGNHEKDHVEAHGDSVLGLIDSTGVHRLELEYVDLNIKGQELRIGGTSETCYNFSQSWRYYHSTPKYAFLVNFCRTEAFKLLLCHKPISYYPKRADVLYEDWNVDLVVSGHNHGGLIRLPFVGCLYMQSDGFFPKRDLGLWNVGKADMLIGAGLGNSRFFRLNDPCELVVIKLVPGEGP